MSTLKKCGGSALCLFAALSAHAGPSNHDVHFWALMRAYDGVKVEHKVILAKQEQVNLKEKEADKAYIRLSHTPHPLPVELRRATLLCNRYKAEHQFLLHLDSDVSSRLQKAQSDLSVYQQHHALKPQTD